MNILLVDDEPTIIITLGDALRSAGYNVNCTSDGLKAWELFQKNDYDCVITDLTMPGMSGMDLLRRIKQYSPDTFTIMVTGYGSVDSAVEAVKSGAYDYIQKPFPNEKVIKLLDNIKGVIALRGECNRLRMELEERHGLHNIIGKSRPMQAVFQMIQSLSQNDCNVVIEGESGVGKELVADAIHYMSPRRNQPLVKLSCSVFPETLIEDELFGHERGAFTDAKEQKIGRFERANNGTIFLDDIDDMSPRTQVKLLRVVQEHELERLGGSATIKVNIRILAATKTNLAEAVHEGRFREDLFYRLNVVNVKLPPLRERTGDISLLIAHFVRKYGKGQTYEMTPEMLAEMETYPWPGNVRELENAVERAIALAGGDKILKREHLLKPGIPSTLPPEWSAEGRLKNLQEIAKDAEVSYIKHVLTLTKGHKGEAAKILGVTRKTLWEKLKDYKVET